MKEKKKLYIITSILMLPMMLSSLLFGSIGMDYLIGMGKMGLLANTIAGKANMTFLAILCCLNILSMISMWGLLLSDWSLKYRKVALEKKEIENNKLNSDLIKLKKFYLDLIEKNKGE